MTPVSERLPHSSEKFIAKHVNNKGMRKLSEYCSRIAANLACEKRFLWIHTFLGLFPIRLSSSSTPSFLHSLFLLVTSVGQLRLKRIIIIKNDHFFSFYQTCIRCDLCGLGIPEFIAPQPPIPQLFKFINICSASSFASEILAYSALFLLFCLF